jgi:hypothetical protein
MKSKGENEMGIDQDSFDKVQFAEILRRKIKRFLKAIKSEFLLTKKLEEATKEKETAGDLMCKDLMPLSDDELLILAKNFPDIEKFITIFIQSRKEKAENAEIEVTK